MIKRETQLARAKVTFGADRTGKPNFSHLCLPHQRSLSNSMVRIWPYLHETCSKTNDRHLSDLARNHNIVDRPSWLDFLLHWFSTSQEPLGGFVAAKALL